MKISLSIEIKNVDDWDVNWNDKDDAQSQLLELMDEIAKVVSNGCGISRNNIEVLVPILQNP